MKAKLLMLVVASALLILPSAYALNCTIYEGSKKEICVNVDPLDISEGDKEALLEGNVYGSINEEQTPINLEIHTDARETKTTEQIFDENIAILVRIGVFIFVNYAIFSVLTKPSKIRRWLSADS